MSSDYQQFINNKKHSTSSYGFEPVFMPDMAFDFQKDIISQSVKKGRIGLFCDTGLGKQQPITEPVLTPDGWSTMGELNIGDYVIGSNGLPTKVTGVFPQGIKRVFRLELSDGSFVRAGEEHLWSVQTKTQKYRKQEFEIKTTKEISESIHRDWQLQMFSPVKTDDVNLPISPYVLGVMLGDGQSANLNNICTDNWIGEKLGWKKISDHKTCEYIGYYKGDKEISSNLKELKLYRLNSETKFVPRVYMNSSPLQRLELLQGLMDTDGYAHPDGGSEFSSTSRNLIDSVCELVWSLGGVARNISECDSTFTHNGEKRQGKIAWRVNLKLPENLNMFKLPRKLENYVNPKKYPPVRIIRSVIDEGVDEEQVCIMVDASDHLYVTRNYIVTHNTLLSLSIAQNIVQKTNGKVLIITPLAVAFQFLKEAAMIGIDDIENSKDGKHTKKIVICNYERLHYFDSSDFEAVVLDESSILKNFNGEIKNHIISFIKKINYRFLTTATPCPNDFIELGNSSEALGYMGYMDMLGKFFKSNQNSVDSNNRNIGEKFYLKPHAESSFFEWINTWSIMIKKPSDLGFSDERYILPKLITNHHMVENNNIAMSGNQSMLFRKEARSIQEIRQVQKETERDRCEKAIELAQGKTSVYWCNTNNESAILKSLDKEAVEIIGSQSIDKKEEILESFANGDIKRIISKAKITGMGLNWQHCNHSVFFPTFSYEQYYQSVRRFWRFGQKSNVTIDLVLSEGQGRIMQALEEKQQKSNDLYQKLIDNVNKDFTMTYRKDNNKNIILPRFF